MRRLSSREGGLEPDNPWAVHPVDAYGVAVFSDGQTSCHGRCLRGLAQHAHANVPHRALLRCEIPVANEHRPKLVVGPWFRSP
jgi:hypothetical protein